MAAAGTGQAAALDDHVAHLAGHAVGAVVDLAVMDDAARRGDPVGQQVCDMYVGYLAAGIANVVNIFQPDTLAIGGGVSNESDEQLLLPLRRQVAAHSLPCNYDKMTKIVKAQLGNDAGIIGAALLGKNKRII